MTTVVMKVKVRIIIFSVVTIILFTALAFAVAIVGTTAFGRTAAAFRTIAIPTTSALFNAILIAYLGLRINDIPEVTHFLFTLKALLCNNFCTLAQLKNIVFPRM